MASRRCIIPRFARCSERLTLKTGAARRYKSGYAKTCGKSMRRQPVCEEGPDTSLRTLYAVLTPLLEEGPTQRSPC